MAKIKTPPYQLSSNIIDKYEGSGYSSGLDKIAFTIDHIDMGDAKRSSTYEVVKYLTDHEIPVTVFMQSHNSENHEQDKENALQIYKLAPHLVTLGIHPLARHHTPEDQSRDFNIISCMIEDITGKKCITLSYHGNKAGPMKGIDFPGIKFARGIICPSHTSCNDDQSLNTPVLPLAHLLYTYKLIKKENIDGRSATLFVHSIELSSSVEKKIIFDTLINDVVFKRLDALHYLEAMEENYRDFHPMITSPLVTGSIRFSALKEKTNEPTLVDLSIQQIDGSYTVEISKIDSIRLYLPVGKYDITATTIDTKKTYTTDIVLTASKGIHHIFHV